MISDLLYGTANPNDTQEADGWRHLNLPFAIKALMGVFALLMMGFLIRILLLPAHAGAIAAVLIGLLLAAIGNWVTFRPSLRWNDERIEYLGPFCRSTVTIRWSEIERDGYMKQGRTFWFKTKSGRKVQLSTILNGLGAFIVDLRKQSNSRAKPT